uniref:Uncharacterized protein n=1 Tax=Anguilla anguilla TaxID=7936 RepID=A0A0E9WTI6_ANGAN
MINLRALSTNVPICKSRVLNYNLWVSIKGSCNFYFIFIFLTVFFSSLLTVHSRGLLIV